MGQQNQSTVNSDGTPIDPVHPDDIPAKPPYGGGGTSDPEAIKDSVLADIMAPGSPVLTWQNDA